MSDLISREAALDAIDKNRQDLLSLGMNGAEHILVRYGRRVIEELPSAQQWIPVSERLPEENDRYFVTAKHKRWGLITTDVLRWQGKRFGWEEQSICTVLAWMPLPDPWRGEEG